MNKKKRMMIGLLLISIFAIYNLVWLANLVLVYHPYIKNIPKHESGLHVHYDKETGQSYNVKTPTYLFFTGNLGVTDQDDSGLIIWPGFFGKHYRYGFRLKDGNQVYQIYVDQSMKPIEADADLKKVLAKNQEKAKKLWQGAETIWQEPLTKSQQNESK